MGAYQSSVFSITGFGAVPDGKTLCTAAFAAAFAACERSGGGTVHVPAGTFLTGPIRMLSNTVLHLDAGARVLFSRNIEDYPLVRIRWEGAETQGYMPQVYGQGIENVTVAGRGELDGQGEDWWRRHRQRTLCHARPRLLCFDGCRNVRIEGVRLRNSPAWTINPICCEQVIVDGVTIENPPDSPNTDGINPESCRHVHITRCHVDVGDDCVTLKAGRQEQFPRVPCENVTISDCTMVHGHGGVVIGSEMSGGVRNVVISNCIFEGTDRGLRIKTRRGRGGTVEDILVHNVVMKDVMCPIVVNMFYHCGEGGKEEYVRDKSPLPVTAETPIVRRLRFSNIVARGARAAAIFLYGLPEMPVTEVSFDRVTVEMAKDTAPEPPAMMCDLEPMARRGVICREVADAVFERVRIEGNEVPGFDLQRARDVEMVGCRAAEGWGASALAAVDSERVEVRP